MVVSGRRTASPLQPAAAVKLDPSGEQYAVLLLNREQISQLLHQPSMRQVNRPVLDAGGSYAAYRRLVRRIRIALVAVAVLVAGASAWAWAPRPVLGMLPWARAGSPLIATGASFSLIMASFQDRAAAEQMARRLRSIGTAAFTRPVPDRRIHQVLVGPYVSLDEAETQQRRLAARGLSGTRLFVDDTLRHVRTADVTLAAPQGNPAMVLVGAIDRASIALEMRSRPRRVTTRRPSGTTMEIEIGPLDASRFSSLRPPAPTRASRAAASTSILLRPINSQPPCRSCGRSAPSGETPPRRARSLHRRHSRPQPRLARKTSRWMQASQTPRWRQPRRRPRCRYPRVTTKR
jgi:hypothetical protein